MNKKFCITIGREFGSGGREIAKKLGERLGVNVYDKNLIAMMAEESGIHEDILHSLDETPTNSFLYALSTGGFTHSSIISPELPLTDKAFIVSSKIIKELAEKESCVVVGRCAEYVLKEHERLLRVFIYTDTERRAKRVSEGDNISIAEAKNLINKMDKKRASYHNYFTDRKWGTRSAYDLCIDSKFGTDAVVDIIISALNEI